MLETKKIQNNYVSFSHGTKTCGKKTQKWTLSDQPAVMYVVAAAAKVYCTCFAVVYIDQ
jgi:hypothetical protein